MRARLRPHCLKLAYLFLLIMLIGATLSGLLTTDTRWMYWHFSRLGEGGMISALIFNIALFISAIIMFTLGLTIADNIAQVSKTTDRDLSKAENIIYRSFTAVTVCLIGLASFPFDRFPVIHNIFGYSMFFIFLGLCVTTPNFLPIFSRKFYIYGRLTILLAIICYILFLAVGSITLLTVEFIMFSFIYGWLLLLINGILKIVAEK